MERCGGSIGAMRPRFREETTAEKLRESGALPSVMVALLRQELDSMIRVLYLLTIRDREVRRTLIAASLIGDRWRYPGRRLVTDADMVARASVIRGWAEDAYRFGCAFIHLSNFHDHEATDPFRVLPDDEKAQILGHMRGYHGGPLIDDPGFADLAPWFPPVLRKIAENLECYLVELESDGEIEADENHPSPAPAPAPRRPRSQQGTSAHGATTRSRRTR